MRTEPNETHILDVIRGQAGPETRETVYARMMVDSEFARTYEFWAQQVDSLVSEAQADQAEARRIVQATLAGLAREQERAPVSLPIAEHRAARNRPEPRVWFGFGPLWVGLATSMAALVWVLLSVESLETLYPPTDSAETGLKAGIERPSLAARPEGIPATLATLPAGTVVRLENGRLTEPMRISKHLTLVAASHPGPDDGPGNESEIGTMGIQNGG